MNRVLKFTCVFAVIFAVETLLFAPFASAAPTITDPASAETPTSTSFMLFKGNHAEGLNGITHHTFRIPAIVKTNAGTLLAFTEGCAKSNKDYGNINVMYKRGSNNGQTAGGWSTLMQAASIGDDTISNPTPVVDCQMGTIWLFMSWNSANTSQSGGANPETGLPTTCITQWGQRRVYVMKSDDDGMTFKGMDGSSKPTDMTATLTPKTRAGGSAWAWDAVGPGAGLYTSDGVIIIPAQFRNIYSKDHSIMWQVQKLPESTGEATIAELNDGSLYRNDRANSTNWAAAKRRWISRGSISGGFSAYTSDDKLLDPENEASILFYNNAETDAPTQTIFLNSASTVTRMKVRFRVSYDNAKTWPMSRPLSDFTLSSGSGTEGGYSSMVKTADKNIGAMVETNLDISNNDVSVRGILWHKLNLGWVLHGCAC
ncbi:glycoside hydrolase family 33 protein [Macrolepiota fuliginosa MF-IS2]|uniref:Glycoside hydrolase family 33 protein n=1 Tax=Macrolepiota fuliginosa MF-IS2 TaxID=1400762 RepID=A0A9P5X2L6_9AGAR|nr:glycoside hydrolase family 33 protein [Macrolepiota fuliginosa MF-IS2]